MNPAMNESKLNQITIQISSIEWKIKKNIKLFLHRELGTTNILKSK